MGTSERDVFYKGYAEKTKGSRKDKKREQATFLREEEGVRNYLPPYTEISTSIFRIQRFNNS